MTLKQRGKMPPKRSSACIGRKCFTVLSTRACRLALSKARNRKSSRSRRTHFPKYPMRSHRGSHLASPVRIITMVTGASSGLCANSSTRLSCPTRSPVRITENVSPSTLLISLREFKFRAGLYHDTVTKLYYGAMCSCAIDETGKQISLACVWALGSIWRVGRSWVV